MGEIYEETVRSILARHGRKAAAGEPLRIQDAVAIVMAGGTLPSETEQRTEQTGMPIQEAVGRLMTAPAGTFTTTLDGRSLVAKKATNEPATRVKYARKLEKIDE